MAPKVFFRFNILICIYSFKYKTIETHARAFLPLNISTLGSVSAYVKTKRKYYWRAPNGKNTYNSIGYFFSLYCKSTIFAISSFAIIDAITSADQPTYVLLWVIFLVSAFSYQMSWPGAKLSQFGHTAFHWNLMHLLWVSVVLRSLNWLLSKI